MKFFRGLLRFIGVLILLFVVVALPFALFARALAGVIFSPDAIVGVIEDNLLDVDFLASVAEQSVAARVAQGPAEPDTQADPVNEMMLAGLNNLSHDQWLELFQLIAPPELVSQTLREIVTGALGWIDSPDPTPAITISIAGWKASIDKNMVPALELILNALPQCTPQEVLYFGLGVALGETQGPLPLCRPPEPFYSDLLATATQVAPDQMAVFPDQMTLGNRTPTPVAAARLEALQRDLRLGRFLMRWGWLIILGLLGLAVWFGARSWPSALKWAGWPVLLSGLLTLVMAVALFILSEGILVRFGAGVFRDVPQPLLLPVRQTARGALALLARPLLLEALLQLVLGVGALIAAARPIKRGGPPSKSAAVRPEDEPPTGMFG